MRIEGELEYHAGKSAVSLSGPVLITEAAKQAGLVVNTSCAGKGTCGGCTVELREGTYKRNGRTFAAVPGRRMRVLGCQTEIVRGPFRIFVPRRSLVETGEQVVSDFVLGMRHAAEPTVRTIRVALPQPVLGQAEGDYERLARQIQTEHGIVLDGTNLPALRALPTITKTENYDLTVRLAWRHDGTWQLLSASPSTDVNTTHAVAIDIGTTTVSVGLVDIEAGKIVDTVSCYNQQIRQADDVAARIVHAGTDHGLEHLSALIIEETLNPLIGLLCRKHHLDCRSIVRAVVSGNTVMWHLFLGIDPTLLGQIPFATACNYPCGFRAWNVGLAIRPEGIVDIVPSISAYVGGDIVSDIYITHLHRADQPEMVIDVGTNGEIALNANGKMFVTACAAGPAFEGLRISCGMRASVGAIERITVDRSNFECEYHMIGDGRPVGLCGSTGQTCWNTWWPKERRPRTSSTI